MLMSGLSVSHVALHVIKFFPICCVVVYVCNRCVVHVIFASPCKHDPLN